MRYGISTKLAIFISLQFILIGGVVSLSHYEFANRELREQLEQRAHAISDNLNFAVENLLVAGNVTEMRRMVANVASSKDVSRISIVDRNSKILADSQPFRIGSRRPEIQIQRTLSDERSFWDYVYLDKQPVLLVINPLRGGLYSATDRSDVVGAIVLEMDTTPLHAAVAASIQKNLVPLIGMMFLVFGLFLWLSRRVLIRPILELNAAIGRITQGVGRARVELVSTDEIGILAKSFNDMLDNLDRTTVSRDALSDSESRYRAVTDSVPDAIVSLDKNGTIIFWNRSAQRIFGYLNSEILGRPLATLMSASSWVSHKESVEVYLKADHGGIGVKMIDLKGLRQCGEEFPMELTLSSSENHVGILFTGIIRDITDRKKLEEEKRVIQTQILQSQKMESVGYLAAGVAHEINNPIQYVEANVSFLKEAIAYLAPVFDGIAALSEDSAPDVERGALLSEAMRVARDEQSQVFWEEMPKAIDQSLEGIRQVAKIVKALKGFSHPGRGEKVAYDINQSIEAALSMSHNEWRDIADIRMDLGSDLPLVPCFSHEINQAFLNLILNATASIESKRKKTGDTAKGLISIKTSARDGSVEIHVQDTGEGIPEANRPRIFDPFFTTREVGRGSGQGLALVHSYIVEGHGGTVHFETEIGVGTTFVVRLPCSPP